MVRTMTRPEVDWAVQLAAAEGWNPGLHDAGCFYQTDPQGFLIGLLDDKPIGCISAVSYEGKFGFIGFYVVLPEYRSQGYGLQIWKAALERLQGHNIGLDGVPDQIANYMKSGFSICNSNHRFENKVAETPEEKDPGIISVGEIPFDLICQYDRQCFPAERRSFLESWLHMPESAALVCVENGKLQGYGVVRQCGKGYKIGPLFSENVKIAERLYRQLMSKTERNRLLYLDIPETNPEAMSLAQKYSMNQVFFTARMYSRGKPEMALNKVFGVTTFELG
jgi:GNAT superfamily N-acetyltransferase